MIFNSLYSLVLRDNWRYSFKKFGCSPCLCAETPFLRFYFLPFFFFLNPTLELHTHHHMLLFMAQGEMPPRHTHLFVLLGRNGVSPSLI